MTAGPPVRHLPLHVRSITDVAERQLCTGCGACAYVQPDDVTMVDDVDTGRRPLVRHDQGTEASTDKALAACPGIGLAHGPDPEGAIREVRQAWGPVLEVWEGHATDPAVRHAASSGGVATALAMDGIANQGLHGVLHIRARDDVPYLNQTVLSTTAAELLAATGSRYAPASPCDRLDLIRDAPGVCMFIGKPCDVAATARVRTVDPDLDAKLGLTIGLFCAGTPTTRGTLEMLRVMGVDDPDRVGSIRYRGNGWPGRASAVTDHNGRRDNHELSYEESWGAVLQKHRQWRCYVCADHTGEFADIAVGDPWYRPVHPEEPGSSLIVVRTERGRRFLAAAVAHGTIVATPVPPRRIADSQPGLLQVRGAVWGRVVTSRLLGIPAPRYSGLATFPVWLRSLTVRDKLRSTIGLVRRAKRKGLRRRHPVVPREAGR